MTGARDGVPNVAFSRRVPVAAGGLAGIDEGISKPGDQVTPGAEMGLLVLVSTCPEALDPAAGGRPTPVRAVVSTPR